jgi:hypothetical protein
LPGFDGAVSFYMKAGKQISEGILERNRHGQTTYAEGRQQRRERDAKIVEDQHAADDG